MRIDVEFDTLSMSWCTLHVVDTVGTDITHFHTFLSNGVGPQYMAFSIVVGRGPIYAFVLAHRLCIC